MRQINVRLAVMGAIFAITLSLAATPAQAAPVTYAYTGNTFTFCGFGCPGQSGDDAAPANWADDFILATLTFDGALAPNLTFADDVLANLLAWTTTDNLGTFFLSSALGHTLGWEGLPGLQLETDSVGNIVKWVMTPTDGVTDANGNLVGTGIGIVNPTFVCPGCGPNDEDIPVADFAGVKVRQPGEWNAGSSVPGSWVRQVAVPEPTALMLTALGLAGLGLRRRRRNSR